MYDNLTYTKKKYLKEMFGVTSIYPMLYLRYDNGNYYIGQSDSLESRYHWNEIKTIVVVKELDTYNKREILELEQEALEFCQAFGLPLANKVNPRSIYTKEYYREKYHEKRKCYNTAYQRRRRAIFRALSNPTRVEQGEIDIT